ncbi:MAG: DUF368 domain-containing protein, partial [Burkholderiales bacterium]|nr:DUF368 domain-containing protein [Burkholderiales bacterium]
MCMGAADVIPGVSGGTIALLLGIYQRLISAISRFDRKLVVCLVQRKWAEAGSHIELRFLIALGAGIVIGFLVMLNT